MIIFTHAAVSKTTSVQPTKSFTDHDCKDMGGFGAIASLSLTQSTLAVYT